MLGFVQLQTLTVVLFKKSFKKNDNIIMIVIFLFLHATSSSSHLVLSTNVQNTIRLVQRRTRPLFKST